MIALLQRVRSAKVDVAGQTVGAIGHGLLVFLGVESTDTAANVQKLAEKVSKYRMFNDANQKMNLNVQQAHGALLVVSQFTLAADTQSGLRPSFTPAALPAQAEALYHQFVTYCQTKQIEVATGQFGADMQVSLVNDGPVTFWLRQ